MSDVVGWKEWVALPDIGIERLKCKVDTGAKTSALHAFDIEAFKKEGQDWVRFSIHTDEHDPSKIQTGEALVQDIRSVTDSSGNVSTRFFIDTTLEIGDQLLSIPISLTCRETMVFNMLLGRSALRKAELIVNPNKSFLQGKK